MHRYAFAIVIAAAFGLVAVQSRADSHAEAAGPADAGFIKYRQKVMSGIGADMGAIADILKKGLPQTDSIVIHAERMEDAAALVEPAFRKRIEAGATDAKPEVWRDWVKFLAAIDAYEKAAAELADAADESGQPEVPAAFRALGKTCGDCHKPFRKPKEESYKNR